MRLPRVVRIILRLTHATIPPGRVEGFSLIWAFYVTGLIPEKHCQFCFKGTDALAFLLLFGAVAAAFYKP